MRNFIWAEPIKSIFFLNRVMQIERAEKEIIIRVSSKTDLSGLQRILNYIRVKEMGTENMVSDVEIEELARAFKSTWWKENKSRFIK